MIEQLIARVFATRNAAHLAHWRTKNCAEHQALGSFYDDVIDNTDSLVEAYQGAFGIVKEVDVKPTSGEIIGILSADVRWIKANAEEITKGLSPLQNLLDNISAVYLTTLYKLKNLS